MKETLILSIDQGTSGTKAIIYNQKGKQLSKGYCETTSSYPRSGFVEQDPLEIFQSTLDSAAKAVNSLESTTDYSKNDIVIASISNQRETFLLWDESGRPLCNAVIWQCKRSVEICRKMIDQGHEDLLRKKTGLLIDPYFSGTKIIWLYQNNTEIRNKIDKGKAYFGTVDTWLLHKLTDGKVYSTDITNASRTLLFNITSMQWDNDLLDLFNLRNLKLPEIYPSNSNFGSSDFGGLFRTPLTINAMVGDSHAAAFGEQCFAPGTIKATMGTGSSLLMNTGPDRITSKNGMATTICWSTTAETHYALEGIIVSCGSLLSWIQDNLKLIVSFKEADEICERLDSSNGVYFIPALSGLGAPFWEMNRKGSFHGLTLGSDYKDMVRAVQESIAFELTAVIEAMRDDTQITGGEIYIDGGVSKSAFIMNMVTSLIGRPVSVVLTPDTSPLGAALLALLGKGIYGSLGEVRNLEFPRKQYFPSEKSCDGAYETWKNIIKGTKNDNP